VKIYDKFALVYDEMGADKHSQMMVKYCNRIFIKFNIKPKTGLDLCCGTGTAVKLLSEKGIEMSGLDQSKQMLAIARKKLKNKANLFHDSLPNFKIYNNGKKSFQKFDLITSFYDSLNYMTTERKLKSTFQSAHMHLKQGGWFIFDMNTPKALKTLWDEQIFSGVKKNMAWVWRNEYNSKAQKATCYATFFRKKGKSYERFDEQHHESGYKNSVVKKLLKDSGFKIYGFYHCLTFEKPTKDTYRICVVAQKRHKKR
jgi:ubiquinone/menaquinone biosynthesis C-methylase UbiE